MDDIGEILVVIPARGGSKRLARKNVLPLAGKPMICWTIEAAIEAKLGARIVVTSDDYEILEVARQYESQGVIAYKRSDELASDTTSSVEVMIDAVESVQASGYIPSTVVLLQPTSPLRKTEDILAALEVYRNGKCIDTVVSVCEVDHPSAWIGNIDKNSRFVGLDLSHKRSQDYQKEYRLNGAIYIANKKNLMDTRIIFSSNLRASVMPKERSMDVDEAFDFRVCEYLKTFY